MNRLVILVAVVAALALPAITVAGANAPASPADRATTAYQMGGAGVTIVDFAFQPAYVAVPVGSTVTWYNAGAAPHTVSSDVGAFDSGTIGSGGGFSLTFSSAGTYTYHCAIHPGMTGAVQVS